MKQNITIALDKELIYQARIIAAQRSTSISHMLSEELKRLVIQHRHYERSQRKAFADLEHGFHLGGCPASREALHER